MRFPSSRQPNGKYEKEDTETFDPSHLMLAFKFPRQFNLTHITYLMKGYLRI